MLVRKLDYMIKGIPHEEKQKIKKLIDPDNVDVFNHLIRPFLKDPNTTDKYKLLGIINWEKHPERIEKTKKEFIERFKKINELCIKNNIYPFFHDPTDLADSEAMREYICKQYPEFTWNEYFGVESYWDYKPPVYDPNVENPDKDYNEFYNKKID